MSTDATSLVMLVGAFLCIAVLLRKVQLSKGLRIIFTTDLVLIGVAVLVLGYRLISGDSTWPNW